MSKMKKQLLKEKRTIERRLKLIESEEEYTFENIHIDHGYGQDNYVLKIFHNDDKKSIGYIEYSDYDSEINMKFIHVSPSVRRKGVGEKLVLKLQSLYPTTEIGWGYSSDEGANLYNKIQIIRRYEKIRKYKKYNF